MRILILILFGVFSFPFNTVGQTVDSLAGDTSIVNLSKFDDDSSSFISLDHHVRWKFNSAHNPEFSDPEFDDSGWHNLPPHPDSVLAAKDSLWNGHGWFRLTFRVDSSFYDIPRALMYDAYGAAEIYLDGQKLASYGKPSTYPKNEIIPQTLPKLYPVMNLKPAKEHVLAIRYSFHNYEYLKSLAFSGDVGIGALAHIERVDQNVSEYQSEVNERAAFVITFVILLIITLLHLVFYFKFPDDKSNLWVFLVTLHLAILAGWLIQGRYFEVRGVLGLLLVYVACYAYYQFLSMVPVALASLLKIKKYPLLSYLPAAGIPFVLIHFSMHRYINENLSNLIPIFAAGLVLVAGFFIIWDAIKLKRRNIWILSAGFLGAPILIILYLIVFMILLFMVGSPDEIPQFLYAICFILSLLSLPVCMSVYVGNMFFDLYGDLETRVKERTRELNEKNEKLESANQKIQQQRDEVVAARDNLQEALENLKDTQEQLVQQEKLASLGQLTAGIAHEIKNPLNFVNNFSDLSVELVEEAREELSDFSRQTSEEGTKKSPFEGGGSEPDGEESGDDPAAVAEALDILDDVEANLLKINEHGSRADGIVKSMLQHSRGGDGKMESTDLNALIEEYVNLAFHGMRASEHPINMDIEMDLDEDVDEIPLIAEDFSRVIINLCNNAFDAMRKKLSNLSDQSSDYSPKLTVRTYQDGGNVIIEIEDNGPGIPEDVRDKIMQPFFTTKEGTEGTGLGLSITNDIVKAHGGELEIESNKEGSVFRIQVNNK